MPRSPIGPSAVAVLGSWLVVTGGLVAGAAVALAGDAGEPVTPTAKTLAAAGFGLIGVALPLLIAYSPD